jgi:HK97 family phage portal protein
MTLFTKATPEPREDNAEPFLDAVISMTSNDSGAYTGVWSLRNSDVYAAVKVIAGDLASNPLEYSDKRISGLLNKAPNSHMTAYAFRFALAVNMLLNGNAFALIQRNNSGQVSGFELIPNADMVVKYDPDIGTVPEYTYTPAGGQSKALDPAEVLHFKSFTQDGYTGLSPLYSLHDEVAIQHTGNKLIRGFFKNGVQGTGILKVNKSALDGKAKDNIRTKFEAANSGDNALKTIILDADMDYKQLAVNADVVKLVNSNNWTTLQIAKAFGLPPDKLGIESEHSNAAQANVNYLQNTLIGYFKSFTAEFDAKLSTGDNRFSFNTDQLFSADPATMQELAVNGLKGSIYTINEARAKMGLPPVSGGDRIIITKGTTTLDMIQQTNTQGSEQIE